MKHLYFPSPGDEILAELRRLFDEEFVSITDPNIALKNLSEGTAQVYVPKGRDTPDLYGARKFPAELRVVEHTIEDIGAWHLNNMFLMLPGGDHRRITLEGDALHATPYSSALFNEQTPRSFIGAIDDAIAQCHVDDNAITNHNQQIAQIAKVTAALPVLSRQTSDERAVLLLNLAKSTQLRHQIHKAAWPVYVLLRDQGYNHYDLTS